MTGIPKIIDDLRPRLLSEARRMLLTDGGQALTIRSVAADCQVAVGTVYNYFRSKDELMAHVILRDWQEALAVMRTGTESAPDVLTGLRCVYDGLTGFCALYQKTWQQHASRSDALIQIDRRHPLLVDQLAQIHTDLLTRHHALWTPHLPVCLAEMLLTASARSENGFEQISPILERLIEQKQ